MSKAIACGIGQAGKHGNIFQLSVSSGSSRRRHVRSREVSYERRSEIKRLDNFASKGSFDPWTGGSVGLHRATVLTVSEAEAQPRRRTERRTRRRTPRRTRRRTERRTRRHRTRH